MTTGNDDWDDAADDDGDEAAWLEEDEGAIVDCPNCGRAVYEDAQRCPYCEQYISPEEALSGRKPWWMVLGVLAVLYVVLRWVFG